MPDTKKGSDTFLGVGSESGSKKVSDPFFPPISELLPHRGAAVLLDRVLAHDATSTSCAADPGRAVLYRDADGRVPSYVGLELMAQTVAVHGGLSDREAGRPTRPGFFLGSRRLVFRRSHFEPGCILEITVRHLRGSAGLLAFDCELREAGHSSQGSGEEPMVSGVLTVYLLESFEALVEDFSGQD